MMARRLNSKSPRVPRACRLRTYSPSNERLPAAAPGLTRRGQGQLHFTNIQNGRPDRIGAPVLFPTNIDRGAWRCREHGKTKSPAGAELSWHKWKPELLILSIARLDPSADLPAWGPHGVDVDVGRSLTHCLHDFRKVRPGRNALTIGSNYIRCRD